MHADFASHDPCRIHCRRNALDDLPGELEECGPDVVLVYGGGVRDILVASE